MEPQLSTAAANPVGTTDATAASSVEASASARPSPAPHSPVDKLKMLLRYKAWANDLLFQTLSEHPESELFAKRQIVFGNILRTLNHVYVMDVVWKAHLESRSHEFSTRNPETTPPFAELRDAQKDIDAWYVRYAQSLDEPASDEVVNFTFIGGGSGSMSRGDILLHVVNQL